MEDILSKGLELAQQLGASYADIRVTRRDTERISVRNGGVESLNRGGNEGFGVRVLKDGAWGFAATPIMQEGDLERKLARTTQRAIEVAQAAARVNRTPVELAPEEPVRARVATPLKLDPFELSLEKKIQDLTDITAALRSQPEIRVGSAALRLFRDTKTFASSEGAYIEQTITQTGFNTMALAVGNGRAERRTYSDHGTGGYELVQQLDPLGKAPQVAREAVQLLTAENCPVGENTLILGGNQVALQLHESCGHPTELTGRWAAGHVCRHQLPDAGHAAVPLWLPEVNINMDATIHKG